MAKAQFDREEIIDKAIQLFWQKGFSASSMQDVVKTTGLKPGSIYLAFGNKEGLFREALEKYAKTGSERIRKTIEKAPSIELGICQHLENFVIDSTKDDFSSCFLVKTRLELAAEGNELHEYASKTLDKIEMIFKEYLMLEYDEDTSSQRATSIMMHIFALRVYGFQSDSADKMRKGLRQGLSWLPWDTYDKNR